MPAASFCALACASVATAAQATVTALTFQPSPVDMNDLDHHLAYTWRIDSISLSGLAVTGATLSNHKYLQLGNES